MNSRVCLFATTALTALSLGTGWCQTTQQADFGNSTMILLPGYKQKSDQGIDTIVGRIVRQGGKYSIGYDIGELAGDYVNRLQEFKFIWRREQQVVGGKAKFVFAKKGNKDYLLVTVYESEKKSFGSPANFIAPIEKQTDLVDVLLMFGTFRWKAKK